jgi:hypothetical protein
LIRVSYLIVSCFVGAGSSRPMFRVFPHWATERRPYEFSASSQGLKSVNNTTVIRAIQFLTADVILRRQLRAINKTLKVCETFRVYLPTLLVAQFQTFGNSQIALVI